MRYVHLEVLDSSKMHVGDEVRVKPSVAKPKFEWGQVKHGSVGMVTGEELYA